MLLCVSLNGSKISFIYIFSVKHKKNTKMLVTTAALRSKLLRRFVASFLTDVIGISRVCLFYGSYITVIIPTSVFTLNPSELIVPVELALARNRSPQATSNDGKHVNSQVKLLLQFLHQRRYAGCVSRSALCGVKVHQSTFCHDGIIKCYINKFNVG